MAARLRASNRLAVPTSRRALNRSNLRGLGPNHTLVLVNGRRIADFPLPFGGRSNFTDISSLPLGMIERIEVLTGSASAIYGSDAISGVVNFILKKEADGITVDYRLGQTERGDAESMRLNISGGFSRGDFNAVLGMEYRDQNPLWGFQRAQQDSSYDAPNPSRYGYPPRNFLITDWWDDYIDPGEETCNSLSNLNEGTMHYANRRNYGYYCGSDRAVAYRTMISKREGVNTYGTFNYEFGNGTRWFADVQAGRHELSLFRAPRSWALMTDDGTEWDYFYNQNTEQLEYWQRQFTLEEMGGLQNGMVNTVQKTFGVTTGFAGTLGSDWDYEAALSHSQYRAEISWPQIVAARANDLFLGPQLGYDEDGYPIYDAPHERLYTPLTRAEYDSIFARTTYKPESETQSLSFTLTNASLFSLPGGDAGFAATAELGHQSYDLKPDPLATQYYYYSWKDSDGKGSRNRWAVAGELRMPLLESLNLSVAGRFDQYRFAGRDPNKFTWSAGLEWRPVDSLLVRGSYGTAFRAPDLHYVFTGPGNDETSVTDFYRCDTEEPDAESYDDCSYGSEGIIRSRVGNKDLEPETSDSWTAGLVWSPAPWLDLSLDYFNIDMRNQVQDLRANEVMRWERDCQLGLNGAVATSDTCVEHAGPRDTHADRRDLWRACQSDQHRAGEDERCRCDGQPQAGHRHRPVPPDGQLHLGGEARYPGVPGRGGRGHVRHQQRLRHPAHQGQPAPVLGEERVERRDPRPPPGQPAQRLVLRRGVGGGRPGSEDRRHVPLQRERAVPLQRSLADLVLRGQPVRQEAAGRSNLHFISVLRHLVVRH